MCTCVTVVGVVTCVCGLLVLCLYVNIVLRVYNCLLCVLVVYVHVTVLCVCNCVMCVTCACVFDCVLQCCMCNWL